MNKHFGLCFSFIAACVFNVACIILLSSFTDARPEESLPVRIQQIHQREQEPRQQRQRKQEKQEQAIQAALPLMQALELSQTLHDFSFPHDPLGGIKDNDWHAAMGVGAMQSEGLALTLDKRAQRKFVPDLSRYYPQRAKRKGIKGYTVLDLYINEQGMVERYIIVESEPVNVFEKAVDKVVKHIRYQAAEHQGKPHKDKQRLKLIWNLQ
jgi:TonB family protein